MSEELDLCECNWIDALDFLMKLKGPLGRTIRINSYMRTEDWVTGLQRDLKDMKHVQSRT